MTTKSHTTTASGKKRSRELGIPFDGTPGKFNAITDVNGVKVGYCTLIEGDGPLVVGKGPIRTGVTAILPRGKQSTSTPVFAGSHSLNGNGEMTGLLWVEESGVCEGPITITNTHSCGIARDATIQWMVNHQPQNEDAWSLPVAGETFDGNLNDINGFHVKPEHVFEAIDSATGGAIELGSVGGGTGMICYDFKGGNGSASRMVEIDNETYTVGLFVQSNFGVRHELVISGVPVGKHIQGNEIRSKPVGSIIAIAATDAPLLPHQLKRLARRISLGMARSGSISHNGSGDIFIALSTANEGTLANDSNHINVECLSNDSLDPIFEAVVQATDEAIIDSIIANETMIGRDGVTAIALPHERVLELLVKHCVLVQPESS